MGARTGASTSTVYQSPARARRQAQKRRAEEKAWAAKNGPVEVRRVADEPGEDE